MTTTSTNFCIGIDVAKQHFDVNTSAGNQHQQFTYNEQGMQQFLVWLKQFQIEIICLEATGGLERKLVCKLHDKNFGVAVVMRKLVIILNSMIKNDQM